MISRATAPRPLLLAAVLVGLLIAAYLPAVGGEFLWDDDAHISANPTVVGPLGLKEIWTTGKANYFPLVLTSFWAQHAVWGLNPLGYHLVTLAFHIGAALLLWRVLRELTVPGAWLGAALWALHPVQVESVAWICELKNTQSAVFFLLAIWAWLRWFQPMTASAEAETNAALGVCPRGPARYYGFALVAAVLAILSKPSTVMLPVVLALCGWWRTGRFAIRDLVPLLPFFALSAAAAGWTIWEQTYRQQALGGEWALSLAERVIVAGRVIWFYLLKLLWPANLAFIYPRWSSAAGNVLAYLPAVAAVAGLLWLGWRRGRAGAWFFAAACFVALLFPVLGFFNVYFFRFSFVGDHFQYLASMAPLALLGAGLSFCGGVAPRLLVGALVLGCAGLTAAQSRYYRDSEALWRMTVARTPEAWMAWNNLGELLGQKGRRAEAVACYQRALKLNPRHAGAYHNIGYEALAARNLPEAIGHFRQALELEPGDSRTHNGLGFALALSGRPVEAVPHYEAALRILPDFVLARRNLAVALVALRRPAEAVPHFERLVAAEPGNALVHQDFADTLSDLGRWNDAVTHYQAALRLAKGDAETYLRLGIALAQAGRAAEAVVELQRAVQLDPRHADAQRSLGLVLRQLGRVSEASDHLARAAALGAERK